MAETLIKNFTQISKVDTEIAGGKGASLGEMTQAGIPVPEGFVILSNSFDRFIEETDLNVEIEAVLDTVDIKEIHTVESASEKIQAMILSKEIPEDIKTGILKFYKNLDCKFVAVRSSATSEDSASAAWAGQLDSFLNTTEETLLENVKKCLASLFTPRAIFYRFENKLNKNKISVAVVVQKMVDSEKSGIAFSVHPVTQDENQIIIEAGFGLGEAIVSGSITPDSHVVDKQGFKILDINVNEQNKAIYKKANGGNEWKQLGKKGKKQVLNEKEIIELSKLIVKIENHYGFPCDIEWAKEKGKFYIVQSRPITTLGGRKLKLDKKQNDDYTLLFSLSGYDVFTLDLIFSNQRGYGEVDYVVFFENGITRAYLSKQGLNECYQIGKSLLNYSFFDRLYKRSKDLRKELSAYKKIKIDEENVYRRWKKTLDISTRFGEIYRYFEQPFQKPLEEQVLKFMPREKLLETLIKNKISKKENKQVVKCLNKLILLGRMKLKLHKSIEKFDKDDSITKYVLRKNNLSAQLVGAMRVDEYEQALQGNIGIKVNKLKERIKGSVFVKENDEWQLYQGKNFDRWKNKVEKSQRRDVRGEVAFPGIARGRVVLHMSFHNITKIKQGDILVSGMTNPQMIPLLRKVAAIITDEGGIACHAAIIARELKIPCIVGTGNATQKLKDGDLIEVDANKGVVKIIKK